MKKTETIKVTRVTCDVCSDTELDTKARDLGWDIDGDYDTCYHCEKLVSKLDKTLELNVEQRCATLMDELSYRRRIAIELAKTVQEWNKYDGDCSHG